MTEAIHIRAKPKSKTEIDTTAYLMSRPEVMANIGNSRQQIRNGAYSEFTDHL